MCSVEQTQAFSTGSGMQFVSGSLSTCTKLDCPSVNVLLCIGTETCSSVSLCIGHLL